jgi:lipopolysaccharide biosynthesis regulator YciM
MYNDEGKGISDPLYDKAEQTWADGDHLEAIRLLREFLARNPRELHARLRVAEIYEKDLNNPLAAALEYEDILQTRFDPDRWGWSAIHLCNLYARLNQPAKMNAWMERVANEVPQTAAARKAREKLGWPEDYAPGAIAEAASETDPGDGEMPRGFKRKKA